MAYDPQLRASDADRDRVAALLREHHAVGRLSAEEFTERLDQALSAKTVGELDLLMRDLPVIDMYRIPDARLVRQSRQAQLRAANSRVSPAWRAAWGVYATVNLICFVVWMVSGFGYPWFLWVLGPWGAALGGVYLTVGRGHSSGRELGQGPGQGQLPGGPG
jgi:hypothetical protein